MLTRIISGVIGAALMIGVLLFGGVWGLAAAMALAGAVAVFELLRAAGFGWGERIPAMAAALAAPLLCVWRPAALLVLAGVYWLYVTVICVVRHAVLPVERAALLWLLPTAAVSGFAAVAALRGMEEGLFYVFLTLVIPWLSDTGAYFTGVAFGKHKLCPVISPKKTVEGLAGGIVFSILAAVAAGWLYGLWRGYPPAAINWFGILLAAAVGAPLSVFGDLFASVVKRRYGVKDYGKIMPGHGGVMDRFDSVLPTAVWLVLLTQFFPLIFLLEG